MCPISNARDVQVVTCHVEEPDPPASLEFLEVAKAIMEQNNIHFPKTIIESVDSYVTMISLLENELM